MTDTVHVLHVDDEPALTETTAEFLTREDDRLEIHTATNVSDGLDLVHTAPVDCVVSDYDLSDRNGIEFLRAVRDYFSDLPFILYTGKGSEEVAMDAISAGVTDYVQKEHGTEQYTVLANRITNAVESYRSEKKLAERNEDLRRYKNMVNSMNDGACIYDEDGRFVVVNEYIADLYNTTTEELEGEKSGLIPLIREEHGRNDPYQALLDGRSDRYSTEISREFPNAGHVVLHLRLVPLIVDGEIEGIVGVSREITELKQREQELRRERDRLDEFAGIVSHDLQNLLTVAIGRAEIVAQECESEQCETIISTLDRMSRLTEDVLWLARKGRGIGEVQPLSIEETVDAAWDIVADRTETAQLRYGDDWTSPVTIEADANRFSQLIENLLTNAIEHGGADTTITVGTLADGFYVEDDGPGIPEDRREDVFTAGYSTGEAGTGFGLRIVEQIVEAHGWEIDVTTGTENGARFEITGVEFVTQ